MKNKITFPVYIVSVTILSIFICVIIMNLSNNESNSYYLKPGDNLNAKIESFEVINGELIIRTVGNSKAYCVKTTKSVPDTNAICWHEINDNYAKVGILKQKKYYIWIKDNNENISNYEIVNPNNLD